MLKASDVFIKGEEPTMHWVFTNLTYIRGKTWKLLNANCSYPRRYRVAL